MRVCFVMTSPLRGTADKLAFPLAKYAGIEFRILSPSKWSGPGSHLWNSDPLRGRVYVPTPPWYDVRDPGHVRECIEWADILHFFNYASPRSIHVPEIFSWGKLVIWHHATGWKENWTRTWPAEDWRRAKIVLQAEGFERLLPPDVDAVVIPFLFDPEDPKWRQIPIERRRKVISWSFIWSGGKEHDEKGFHFLHDRFVDVPHDGIARIPFGRTLRRKANSWLGIADFLTPYLHNSEFEYLLLGVPCMRSYDAETERTLLSVTGASRMPFALVSPETVREKAIATLSVPIAEWAEECAAARRWMETHYHARDHAARYVDVYEGRA